VLVQVGVKANIYILCFQTIKKNNANELRDQLHRWLSIPFIIFNSDVNVCHSAQMQLFVI